MSPPPLLSVTVKERLPIIVTVNTTTDAEFAVTTPDLHVKDGPPPPSTPHGPSQTFIRPLIVPFVNIANRGYANWTRPTSLLRVFVSGGSDTQPTGLL